MTGGCKKESTQQLTTPAGGSGAHATGTRVYAASSTRSYWTSVARTLVWLLLLSLHLQANPSPSSSLANISPRSSPPPHLPTLFTPCKKAAPVPVCRGPGASHPNTTPPTRKQSPHQNDANSACCAAGTSASPCSTCASSLLYAIPSAAFAVAAAKYAGSGVKGGGSLRSARASQSTDA